MKWILLAILFLIYPFTAHAEYAFTERYVDCKDGNDTTGDGLAPGTAWKTIQKCGDSASAGWRCNIKGTDSSYTCTLSASIDLDTAAGDNEDPIVYQGFDTTAGDGTHAIVDGNSAATNIFAFTTGGNFSILRHITMSGSTGDAIAFQGADRISVVECKIEGFGAVGIDATGGALEPIIVGNEITGSGGDAIDMDDEINRVFYNYIHDITGFGVDSVSTTVIVGNIFDSITGDAITWDAAHAVVLENTFYNIIGANSSAIDFGATFQIRNVVINNIMSEIDDHGIDTNAASNTMIGGYNVFHNITDTDFDSNARVISDFGGDSTANPTFADPDNASSASRDFGIGALDDLGYPTTYIGTSTVSHREMGATMYEETAGGGTNAAGAVSVAY